MKKFLTFVSLAVILFACLTAATAPQTALRR